MEEYVTSYKEVSAELAKKLIKLYSAKIFPRQGKIFADMLFTSGVEAGSYLAALADIEERAVKINLATNAMIQLNQTEYLVNVMLEAGYYAPYHVAEIQEYLDGLTRSMKELLISAYSQRRTDAVHPVVASAPMQRMPEAQRQDSPRPKANPDPDGFNAPAGKD